MKSSSALNTARHRPLVALILAAFATAATAQTEQERGFSGFATLAVSQSDTNDAEFASSTVQPSGVRKKAEFEVDSKVGLQGVARFSPSFSGTLQALAKKNSEDKFEPDIERAFFRYSYKDWFSVSAGRVAAPIFMMVDDRERGYAQPGVRLPVEVYGAVPLSRIDGAEVTYRERYGNANVYFQLYGGRWEVKLPPVERNTIVEADLALGGSVRAQVGSFQAKAGLLRSEITVDSQAINALVARLRTPGVTVLVQQAIPLAEKIELKDDAQTLATLGLSYDNGAFLLRVEGVKSITDGDAYGNFTASYATVAYRVGKFLPSISYATISPDVDLANTLQGVSLVAAESALVDAYIAANNVSQNTTSFALRYDWMRNIAVKFQYDKISADRTSNLLVNRSSQFAGDVTLYTVSLDIIF